MFKLYTPILVISFIIILFFSNCEAPVSKKDFMNMWENNSSSSGTTSSSAYSSTASSTTTILTNTITVVGVTGASSISGGVVLQGRTVYLSNFWIANTEVTYAQWYEVYQWAISSSRGINIYSFANSGQEGSTGTLGAAPSGSFQPVSMVSWRDVIIWCNALSELEGLTPVYYAISGTYITPLRTVDNSTTISTTMGSEDNPVVNFFANGYRLPTEAEWEYASRGGQSGISNGTWSDIYSGSNNCSDVAWWYSGFGGNTATTQNVHLKPANALGLYDMSGNVYEWCWDWYEVAISTSGQDPRGPVSGDNRMSKGGCYLSGSNRADVSYRISNYPYSAAAGIGFRVVKSQ